MKLKIVCIIFLAGMITSCKNEVVMNANEIVLSGLTFSPGTLTVPSGTTVTWVNNEAVTHTVTSDSTLFDSGNMVKGNTFSYTFSTAGTFAYHCKYHSNMTGKIIVQGGSNQAPNTVLISGFAFVPATLTIKAGTSVTWTNKDAALHTATSTTTAFDSGDLAQNKSFTFKFTAAGTFPYICLYHTNMTGQIIVQP